MADTTAEKKVRSIRADEETFAKFKAVCEELGGQQEALSALVSSYELETAKGMLQGQATTIDDFKSRIDGIVRAYIYALDMSVNAEERIRAEFRASIDTQTKTIADLQARNEKLTSDYDNLAIQTEQNLSTLNTKLSELTTAYDTAEDRAIQSDKQREQAEKIASLATEKLESLQEQVAEMTEKVNLSDSYKAEVEKSKAELTVMSAEITTLKQQLAEQQERYIAEKTALEEKQRKDIDTDVKIAVAEVKEQYLAKIEEIQKEHTRQIAELLASKTKMPSKTAKQ